MIYVPIDRGETVYSEEIIGVFDLDITSQSHITREYLKNAEKRGSIETTAEDIPKTFIVCEKGDMERVYLAGPNTSTILKRTENKAQG